MPKPGLKEWGRNVEGTRSRANGSMTKMGGPTSALVRHLRYVSQGPQGVVHNVASNLVGPIGAIPWLILRWD